MPPLNEKPLSVRFHFEKIRAALHVSWSIGQFWLGAAFLAAEKIPEQHLLECRLRPMTYSWLADAVRVRNPPVCEGLRVPWSHLWHEAAVISKSRSMPSASSPSRTQPSACHQSSNPEACGCDLLRMWPPVYSDICGSASSLLVIPTSVSSVLACSLRQNHKSRMLPDQRGVIAFVGSDDQIICPLSGSLPDLRGFWIVLRDRLGQVA